MKNNRARLQKIEDALMKDDMVVYVSHDLEDSVPRGMVGKIVNNEDLIILSREEYLAEIHECNNLISVGAYHEKQ